MNNLQKLIGIPMQRNICNCWFNFNKQRLLSSDVLSKRSLFRNISNKARDVNEINNQPIKYTASAAGKFTAKSSLMNEDNRLWYEPYVIIVSLGAFLIYFLILREENDLDEEIFMPLHKRMSGIEEIELKSVIETSTSSKEVSAAKLRLEEIQINNQDRGVIRR